MSKSHNGFRHQGVRWVDRERLLQCPARVWAPRPHRWCWACPSAHIRSVCTGYNAGRMDAGLSLQTHCEGYMWLKQINIDIEI